MSTNQERSLEEIIQSQLLILPEHVRNMVMEGNWRTAVYKIGQKYNLHIDELGELEHEIFLVMIGLESSSNLVSNMLTNVTQKRDVVSNIIKEVNETVFEPLRDFIRQTDREIAAIESGAAARASAPITPTTPTPLNAPYEEDAVPSRDDLLREIEEVGGDTASSSHLVAKPSPLSPGTNPAITPVSDWANGAQASQTAAQNAVPSTQTTSATPAPAPAPAPTAQQSPVTAAPSTPTPTQTPAAPASFVPQTLRTPEKQAPTPASAPASDPYREMP